MPTRFHWSSARGAGAAIRGVAAALFFFIPDPAGFAVAGSLKSVCQFRCAFHRNFCLESVNPSLSGAAGNGVCSNACVDAYSACSSSCDASNTPGCLNSCNTTLASCGTTCSQAKTACNDTFQSCRRGCDSILECTNANAAICGHGNVCEDNKCRKACKNNADCKTILHSDDAICLTLPPNKGKCALQ